MDPAERARVLQANAAQQRRVADELSRMQRLLKICQSQERISPKADSHPNNLLNTTADSNVAAVTANSCAPPSAYRPSTPTKSSDFAPAGFPEASLRSEDLNQAVEEMLSRNEAMQKVLMASMCAA